MSHFNLTFEHNGKMEHELYVADSKIKAIEQWEHEVEEGVWPDYSKYIDCVADRSIH